MVCVCVCILMMMPLSLLFLLLCCDLFRKQMKMVLSCYALSPLTQSYIRNDEVRTKGSSKCIGMFVMCFVHRTIIEFSESKVLNDKKTYESPQCLCVFQCTEMDENNAIFIMPGLFGRLLSPLLQ